MGRALPSPDGTVPPGRWCVSNCRTSVLPDRSLPLKRPCLRAPSTAGWNSFAFIPFEQPARREWSRRRVRVSQLCHTNGEVVAACSGQALPGAAWFFDNQKTALGAVARQSHDGAHLDNSVGFTRPENMTVQLDVFRCPAMTG